MELYIIPSWSSNDSINHSNFTFIIYDVSRTPHWNYGLIIQNGFLYKCKMAKCAQAEESENKLIFFVCFGDMKYSTIKRRSIFSNLFSDMIFTILQCLMLQGKG